LILSKVRPRVADLLPNLTFADQQSDRTAADSEVIWSGETNRFDYRRCGPAHHSVCTETAGSRSTK